MQLLIIPPIRAFILSPPAPPLSPGRAVMGRAALRVRPDCAGSSRPASAPAAAFGCLRVHLCSALSCVRDQLRPRSAAFALSCVRAQLRSRSAAFAFSCVRVQLRSRSAALCVWLRSANIPEWIWTFANPTSRSVSEWLDSFRLSDCDCLTTFLAPSPHTALAVLLPRVGVVGTVVGVVPLFARVSARVPGGVPRLRGPACTIFVSSADTAIQRYWPMLRYRRGAATGCQLRSDIAILRYWPEANTSRGQVNWHLTPAPAVTFVDPLSGTGGQLC
eukprot:gene13872-biopygen1879